MQAAAESYGKLLERYATQRKKLSNLSVAKDLLGAQYRLSSPAEFDLTESSMECAVRAFTVADQEARHLNESMAIFENGAWTRLGAAVQWVLDGNGPFTEDERGKLVVLVKAQRDLAAVMPRLWRLHDGCNALELLYANAKSHPNGVVLQRQIDVVVARLIEDVREVGQGLAATTHPYLHGDLPIPSVLNDSADDGNRAARAHRQAKLAIDTYVPLAVRTCGDLARWTLKVEPLMAGTVGATEGLDAVEDRSNEG